LLEPRAHELHDEPLIVAVADQGRAAIRLTVHESIGGRDVGEWSASRDGVSKTIAPPRGVDGGGGSMVALEESKGDFGVRTPECPAEWLVALIVDEDDARE